MTRSPKELLEAMRKVLKDRKERKKRNPVIVVKQHGPEQADTQQVRCNGQTEAKPAERLG